MPDISFLNESNHRQNVVRAFVATKREIKASYSKKRASFDPFDRRSVRPRMFGWKPVIPVETVHAETTEIVVPI